MKQRPRGGKHSAVPEPLAQEVDISLAWGSSLRIGVLLLLLAAFFIVCFSLPMEKLRGGYVFGPPLGFMADSVGATTGATAAFLIGGAFGRSFVISKLKNNPKFQAVAVAIKKSGFKRNTFALVYVGTTLKYLSDVNRGWNEISTSRWMRVFMALGFPVAVMLIVYIV